MKKTLLVLAGMIVFGAILRLTESDETRAKREAAEAAAEKQRIEARAKADAEQAEAERVGGPETAKRMAKQAVERLLKAPASAQFGEASAARKGDSWLVVGTVDSQNGFGAMIRSEYLCDVQKAGDEWKLVSPCAIQSR